MEGDSLVPAEEFRPGCSAEVGRVLMVPGRQGVHVRCALVAVDTRVKDDSRLQGTG